MKEFKKEKRTIEQMKLEIDDITKKINLRVAAEEEKMRATIFPAEVRQKVDELFAAGMTSAQVAAKLGLPAERVRMYYKFQHPWRYDLGGTKRRQYMSHTPNLKDIADDDVGDTEDE